MSSFFSDFGEWVNETRWKGWSLGSPNKYTFTGRNAFFKNGSNSVYRISLNTNFSSNFSVGLKITF